MSLGDIIPLDNRDAKSRHDSLRAVVQVRHAGVVKHSFERGNYRKERGVHPVRSMNMMRNVADFGGSMTFKQIFFGGKIGRFAFPRPIGDTTQRRNGGTAAEPANMGDQPHITD